MAVFAKERIELPALADDDGLASADKILFAVQKVVELAAPLKVVAFGSRARGDHRKNSDLDLVVIVEKYDKKDDPRPIWRADLDVWMDMDVLVYDVARDEAMRDSVNSLQSEVRREGVVLYDRDKGFIDREAASGLV